MLNYNNKDQRIDRDFLLNVSSANFKKFVRFFLLREQFYFSEQSFFLIGNMDGKTPNEDLKRKFKERYSIELADKDLMSLIRNLKKNKLLLGINKDNLLSSFSSCYRSELTKKYKSLFKKMKTRNAIFDGSMYEADPRDLNKDLKTCFASVDEKKMRYLLRYINILKGVIVPHSNMEQSGTCAAWAYRAIELKGLPDLIILLVPNHAFMSQEFPFSVCAKSFRTPLGVVKADKYFIDGLARECKFDIFQGDFFHAYEHAIEVQLPFLQFIYNSARKHFSIVPIMCDLSYLQTHNKCSEKLAHQFLNSLRNCLTRSKKRALVIASGDLHHQNGLKISADFHEKNQKIIQAMERSEKKVLPQLSTEGIYTCCRHPFFAFLELLKPKQGFLLDYSWSGRENYLLKVKGQKKQYAWPGRIGFASMVF